MSVYQFVLATALAAHVGFSPPITSRFVAREPMQTGIVEALRLRPSERSGLTFFSAAEAATTVERATEDPPAHATNRYLLESKPALGEVIPTHNNQ